MEPVNLSSSNNFNVSVSGEFLNLKTADSVKKYRAFIKTGDQTDQIKDASQLEGIVEALKLLGISEITDLSNTKLKQKGIETDQRSVEDRTSSVAGNFFNFENNAKYHDSIDHVFKNTIKPVDATKSKNLEPARVSTNETSAAAKVKKAVKDVFGSIGNFFYRIGTGISSAAKWVWSHTFGRLIQRSKDHSVAQEKIAFKNKLESIFGAVEDVEIDDWMDLNQDKLRDLNKLDNADVEEDDNFYTFLERVYNPVESEISIEEVGKMHGMEDIE